MLAKTFIFAENLTGINIEKTFWMSLLSDKIINWYKENKRDLPWRNTKNPYKIWISEILKNTKGQAVINELLTI